MDRVGATRRDLISGPAHSIWPSDHAGLVASLLLHPSLAPAQ
jgi:hypothetical protein